MKSLIIRIIGLIKSCTLAVAVMVTFISTAAFAEGGMWSLDSSTSTAVLFQGSAQDPLSLNTGVARVTGEVSLGTDLDHSVVDLSIFPADEDWDGALTLESDLPTGYVPDATDHTLLTFKSKRILKTKDGNLEVIGDLTLIRVERSVTMTPTEAYAGPVYGDPVIHTETRETTFLFPSSSANVLSGPSTSATPQTKGAPEVSGATRIGYEDFPQLLNAIKETNWPTVVRNEDCQMPSTIGADYSGPRCTGTVIAAVNDANCQMPGSVGEDYSGAVCTPAAGNQTTIVLDLKLLPSGSEQVAGMVSQTGDAVRFHHACVTRLNRPKLRVVANMRNRSASTVDEIDEKLVNLNFLRDAVNF
jgi:polyisoprenoid-binding protein YceI